MLVGRGQAQAATGGRDFANLKALSPTVSSKDIATQAFIDAKPALSPDGKRMALMSDRGRGFCDSNSGWCDEQIWEGLTGARPFQLTCPPFTSGGDDAPAYVADGSALLYVSWRHPNDPVAHATIRRLEIPARSCLGGGASSAEVVGFQGEDALDPAPGPATQLAYVHRQGESTDVELSTIDGSGSTVLTNFHDVRQPAWSPDAKSLAFLSPHAGTVDLWVMDVAGAQPPRRVTWGADIDANARVVWIR